MMLMIKAAMAVVVFVDVVAGALVLLLTSKPRTRITNNTPTPLASQLRTAVPSAHFPLHRPYGVHCACCLCFLEKEATHIYYGRSWLCLWRDPGVTQGEGEVPHELVIPLVLERATI